MQQNENFSLFVHILFFYFNFVKNNILFLHLNTAGRIWACFWFFSADLMKKGESDFFNFDINQILIYEKKENQIWRSIMEFLNLLIALISGAVGGNITGAAAPDKSLGTLGNSLSGILGGGLGSYLLQATGLLTHAATTAATAADAGGIDLASILGSIGGGGVGGAVLTLIVGLIKNAIDKK